MKLVLVTVVAALCVVSSVDAKVGRKWEKRSDHNLKIPPTMFGKRQDFIEMFMKNMETERESEAYVAMVEKLWKELNEKVQKYIDENQTEKAAVMSSEEVEKEPPKTNVVRKREDSEVEDEDYSMQADEPVEDDFSVESSDEFDYDMAANAFLEMLMQLYESNH